MRLTKTFGLAALAAVAAMAFVGVTSASATNTVYCRENILVCPEGKRVQHKLIYATLLGPAAVFLTNIANVTCTNASYNEKVLLLASPLVFHLETNSFTSCKEDVFGGACTVATVKLGLTTLLKTGSNRGVLKVENHQFLVNCASLGLHCVYGNPTTEIEDIGSNGSTLGSVIFSEESLPKVSGGFFCPSTTKFDATYAVSAEEADLIYITE